jgi:CPA1 family monovalent cation:H+ antiporter
MEWLLMWGRLRGGISVALALSLRERATWGGESQRELILTITYVVVVFSILVQGMTVGPSIRRLLKTPDVAKLNTPHPPLK